MYAPNSTEHTQADILARGVAREVDDGKRFNRDMHKLAETCDAAHCEGQDPGRLDELHKS